jgi:hypothetical protein
MDILLNEMYNQPELSDSYALSDEQRIILKNVQNGKNVTVNAVAGSGKSTTILSIAKYMPHKKFVQITYNSMLRKEFREKITSQNIKNVEVHTYHSLANRYFLSTAHTDIHLRQIMRNNLPPIHELPSCDIVVLDEVQDCSLLYYQFVIFFIKTMCKTDIQLLLLGDYMQKIYEFKGADCRFLTQASDIWSGFSKLSSPEFINCSLGTSYRITHQIADFINNVMIGEDRINACKSGEPVMYIRNSRANIEKVVVYTIKKLLGEGVKPNDIFILGASVRGVNSNIRRIENSLVESDIPCHVPMLETREIDERVINGKVVFSTFHACKGRQRKHVFVVGFDQSYFSTYARNIDSTKCPNTLYVAATRAMECLYLLETDQYATDRPLEFLKMTHHEMKEQDYITFKGNPRSIFYESTQSAKDMGKAVNAPTRYITPTELIKFIPESVIENVTRLLEKIFVKETIDCGSVVDEFGNTILNEPQDIDIPATIQTNNGSYEDVSELTGIVIPIVYFDYIKTLWRNVSVNMDEIEPPEGENSAMPVKIPDYIMDDNILYKLIYVIVNEMKDYEHLYLKKMFHELNPLCRTTSDYLYMANLYIAFQERLYFKIKQISRDEYNWLDEDIVNQCKDRLDIVVGVDCKKQLPEIEKTVVHHNMDFEHTKIDEILASAYGVKEKFRFSARVDLVTDNTVWELKCVSSLTTEHLIQTVIYAWICRNLQGDSSLKQKSVKIFNIKTGELLRVEATDDELTEIMVELLKGKYQEREVINDTEFVDKCRMSLNV